jgi:hypothetical protein
MREQASKHTSGPWEYLNDAFRPIFRIRSLGEPRLVVGQAVSEDDARLIAAAPDLLQVANEQLALINHAQVILAAHLSPDGMSAEEAISKLLALLDGPDQRRISAMYNAAIAKAEGRTHA